VPCQSRAALPPAPGRLSRFSRLHLGFHGIDLRLRGIDGAIGLGPRDRLAVGCHLRGVLRAFAAVECVVEGEAIVALIDRLLRIGQRQLGGGEFLGRVLVGARRLRGIQRSLGLLHFLVGRFSAAPDRDEQRKTQSRQDTRAQGHLPQYTRTNFGVVR